MMPASADDPAPVAVIALNGEPLLENEIIHSQAGEELLFEASYCQNICPETTYAWNTGYGWGRPSYGTEPTFSTMVDTPIYEGSIYLKVTNPDGQYDSTWATIYIRNYPASITSLSVPQEVCIGEVFEATASVREGGICCDPYSWNWGNPAEDEGSLWANGGIKDYQLSCTHSYDKEGEYEITFTLEDIEDDGNGCPISKTRTITVKGNSPATPVPEFPAATVPAALIIGLLGIVLIIRQGE